MARANEDRYSNFLTALATETAQGTLTFSEIQTGISLGQGTGMLIDQIDYYPASGIMDDLINEGDEVIMAFATSNSLVDLGINNRAMIHQMTLRVQGTIGTPASAAILNKMPFVHQFFPAMIVAAPRLFFGIISTSVAAAASARARMYFRYTPLTDKEYLELAETFILVG